MAKIKKKLLSKIIQDNKGDLRPYINDNGSLAYNHLFYDNNCGISYDIKCPRILSELLRYVYDCGIAKAKTDIRNVLEINNE